MTTTNRLPLRADLCRMRGFFYVGLILFLRLLLTGSPAAAQVITVGPDSTVVAPGAAVPAIVTDSAITAATASADPPGLSRPAKAALWGLIPGGGQVYNRDYWKLPIVYGAMGGITYSIIFANTRYREFARGYTARTDNDDATTDTGPRSSQYAPTTQGNNNVRRAREFYRRNRDLSAIGAFAIYGLSIAEALVDAHLATFDVSDDLSLRVAPAAVPQFGAPPAPGVTLTLFSR